MSAEPTRIPSALRRLAWLVVPLLLLAVATNYDDLRRVLRGEKSVQQVVAPRPLVRPALEVTVEIPEDRGPLDAKVKLEVFLTRHAPCTCHLEAAALGEAVAALDPKHLRVDFADLDEPAAGKRVKALGAPISVAGFALDGDYKFRVPSGTPESHETREVDFFAAAHDWTFEDVFEAWSQRYEAAYNRPPPVTREAFVKRLTDDVQRALRAQAPSMPMPRGPLPNP